MEVIDDAIQIMGGEAVILTKPMSLPPLTMRVRCERIGGGTDEVDLMWQDAKF